MVVHNVRKAVLMQQTVRLIENIDVDLVLALLDVRLDLFQRVRRRYTMANLYFRLKRREKKKTKFA